MKTASKSLITLFGLIVSILTSAQVPVHNSYPSASATIFLDFDGHLVNGTSWNNNGPIACGPANMTNDQITEVFNRVAEDYRPFNVNITTDSTKYWAAPQFQRLRVIITITSSWYGSAGGVSYLGSFKWGDNTPCFVFSALLGHKTKNVAEAASHEIGHTLGLNHQSAYDVNCAKTEYNPGTGTGEIAWAPIMGVGYYRNLTLWHNGTNSWGCSFYQDDLSLITSNGFGFRTDDYSENIDATTAQVNFSNNQFSVSGVVERITDKDAFKFVVPAQSNFHLDADPFSVGSSRSGSNLDLKIELLNSSQTIVGSYNPDLTLNATIDTMLEAGTYYLRIQSMGNIYAPEYATLGSYNLAASIIPSGVLPLRRLELNGSSENNRHKFNWIIDADENVVQQILEASADGINFQAVTTVNAGARTYAYVPQAKGILYYRLKVTFDNNRQYFSNTIAIKNAVVNRPSTIGNFVQNFVQVTSPSPFSYTIVDFSGRSISKGQLVQGMNAIYVNGLSKGMYIIQYSNGQEQYAEKFMKQ